jgi:hypothetical protein
LLFSATPQGKSSYGIIRHQLKDFINVGMDQFVIALKKEKAPRGHFVNVTDVLDSLFKDVLKGETIIEYPIFYIWLKSDDVPKEVISLEEKKMLIMAVKEEEETAVEEGTVEDATATEEIETEEDIVDKAEEEEEEAIVEEHTATATATALSDNNDDEEQILA